MYSIVYYIGEGVIINLPHKISTSTNAMNLKFSKAMELTQRLITATSCWQSYCTLLDQKLKIIILTKLKRNFIYQLHLLRLPGMSRTFGTRSKKLYQQGKGHYFCDESEFASECYQNRYFIYFSKATLTMGS